MLKQHWKALVCSLKQFDYLPSTKKEKTDHSPVSDLPAALNDFHYVSLRTVNWWKNYSICFCLFIFSSDKKCTQITKANAWERWPFYECSDCFLSDSKGKTFLLRTRKTFRVLVNSNGSSGQYICFGKNWVKAFISARWEESSEKYRDVRPLR